MKLASFEAITRSLNTAGVRYLIAGGLAVNAHGYLRFTKDADLVIVLAHSGMEGRSSYDTTGLGAEHGVQQRVVVEQHRFLPRVDASTSISA